MLRPRHLVLRIAGCSLLLLGAAGAAEPPAGRFDKARHADPPQIVPDAYGQEVRARLDDLEDPAFFIVLIPDPVDSHLARDFDVYLSALREAMGSIGYQLDRFELPWPRFADEGHAELEARWTPAELRNAESKLTRFRRMPGVLIFRDPAVGDITRPREIVAYLVGETPTWGIQASAFQAALAEVAAYRRRDPYAFLGILGPTYSGSVASVVRALETSRAALAEGKRSIPIVSGTASRAANKAAFAGLAGVAYDQLPVSTEYRLRELIATMRLRDPHIQCEDILLLRESSVFGAPGKDAAPLCDSNGDGSFDRNDKALRSVTYPIYISELRRAHEQLHPAAGTGAKSAGLEIDPIYQNARLPLSLSETATPDDRAPLYGRNATPQTLDMMIGEVLRLVDIEDTLAVGILGTNVRDKLFLASEVAKHAGDVRMFTDETDILLAHPRFAFATHGIMTVSTNSMRDWDDGIGRLSFFASDAAHGFFRAARQLAAEAGTGEAIECIPERDSDKTLWTGMVGRGRIVPVSCSQGTCETTPSLPLPEVSWAGSEPPRKRLWVLLLCIHGCLAWLVVKRIDRKKWPLTFKAVTGSLLVAPFMPLLSRNLGAAAVAAPAAGTSGAGPETLILCAVAFVPAFVSAVWLAEEARENLFDAISKALEGRLNAAAGWWSKVLRLFEGALPHLLLLIPGLLAAPYVVIGLALATPRHTQLDNGLSLIPPAAMAHAAATAFALLFLERRRLGRSAPNTYDSRFRLFGTEGPAWKRKVGLAVGILLAPALLCEFTDIPLARTLEGAVPFLRWQLSVVDWWVSVCLIGLTVLSLESLAFARGIVDSTLTVRDEGRQEDLLRLWRASVLAGPGCLLLVLLGIEMYPFQPRGLLVLFFTIATAGAVLAAVRLLLREDELGEPGEEKSGIERLMALLRKDSVPVAVVLVSALSLLPTVRERFGGLVDLVAKLLG